MKAKQTYDVLYVNVVKESATDSQIIHYAKKLHLAVPNVQRVAIRMEIYFMTFGGIWHIY